MGVHVLLVLLRGVVLLVVVRFPSIALIVSNPLWLNMMIEVKMNYTQTSLAR